MRTASIDIGSNTALLLVVEPGRDGWRVVADIESMPRIAAGLDASGALANDAIERTLDVARNYARRMDEMGVRRRIATGTAPFRRAQNGPAAAQRLSEALGVELDIVSGDHEARLSLLATRKAFPDIDSMRIVDIGGASTEVTQLVGDDISSSVSLDVGSVRLTERCLRSDPPTAEELRVLDEAIVGALESLDAAPPEGTTVVGIAGTVTTLAAIALEVEPYDGALIHGRRLGLDDVRALTHRLAALPLERRREIVGLSPRRADVIVAGAQLLVRILEHAGVDEVLVSDRGTRWGRLYERFGDGLC